jgi:exopolyphosphatase / guanosine-5'-triphosphate,3'-diphosphate pyrophosphatase
LPDDSACGLDLGSNTFSFSLVDRGADGLVEIVRDGSIPSRLSEKLEPGGALHPPAVARSLAVLERIADRLDLDERPTRAVATQALRMTADPSPFTGPAERLLGVPVEIIDPVTEARMACRGALVGLDPSGPFAAVDVGGQSTEVSWGTDPGSAEVRSLPIGAVGLTARHLRGDPPSREQINDLRVEIRAALNEELPDRPDGSLVALAGTATTLAMLQLGLKSWRREAVHGLEVERADLLRWLDRMLAVDSGHRTAQYGIRPGRADVFPAGLAVLDEIMEHTGRDRLTISANGLRVGAALTLLDEGGRR